MAASSEASSTSSSTESASPAASDSASAVASDSASAVATTPAASSSAAAGGKNVWATTPATGTTIKGSGYTYVVPKGWKDARKQAGANAAKMDTVVANFGDTDGFAANINVIKTGIADLAKDPEAFDKMREQLEAQGGTGIKELPATTLQGAPAVRYKVTMQGNSAEQWLVSQGKETYVLTFSDGKNSTDPLMTKTFGPIVSSWKWTA
ncbi:hypothetical protein GCM10009599_20990 [Luteococcus peritonei]